MKMQEIRSMAKQLGINSYGKARTDLIHQIQRAEGNYECFGTAGDYCDQSGCCFRAICLKEKAPS